MSLKNKYHSRKAVFTILASVLLLFASLYISSCSDRLKGDKTPNNEPQVYFVNIPPDGYKESFNDVIHWVGSDNDGQVEMFRYIVVKEELILAEGMTVEDVARDLKSRALKPPVIVTDTFTSGIQVDTIVPDTLFIGGDTLYPTYLEVTIDEPMTSNIVPMSASLNNPVLEYVPQYVFLQAFDDQNASSNVAYLLILRNDYPPETDIVGVDADRDYINAETSGGVNTGIPVRWEGSDPDLEDTLFEFQWRLYGPYEYLDTLNSSYQYVLDNFIKTVFVTNTAEIFVWDTTDALNEFFVLVDSSYVCDTLLDSCFVEIEADTIYVDDLFPLTDSIGQWGIYGRFDTLFDVNDEDFINDPEYNSVQLSSGGWVSNVRDTLYDVFPAPSDPAADTTRSKKFIFWIQARDAAQVVDLTPDYVAIKVIQPRYEREVLVIDFSSLNTRINAPFKNIAPANEYLVDTAVYYWDSVLHAWNPNIEFDLTPIYTPNFTTKGSYVDYVYKSRSSSLLTLRKMLQYKIIILYNDDIEGAGMVSAEGGSNTTLARNVYIAIEAGVNVWATMRAPIVGGVYEYPQVGSEYVNPGADFAEFFGIDAEYGMVYSGWAYEAFDLAFTRPHRRIEDFIGAVSLNESKWPDLSVDTTNLQKRYNWDFLMSVPMIGSNFTYIDTTKMSATDPRVFKPADLHALPEVNWASRVYGTEGMYLYKSYYGLNHPLGFDYSFEGAPVAHRYNTDLYRTVFFCFTPLGIEDGNMQQVIDTVLNWLYPRDGVVTTPNSIRYPDAKVKVDMAQARAKYWREFESAIDEEVSGKKPVGRQVTGLR